VKRRNSKDFAIVKPEDVVATVKELLAGCP
jgi:hypothetical protein